MTRHRLLVALMLLVISLGGVLAWFWLARPRTLEEQVLAVHEDLFEAFVEEDFDDVWDLLSEQTRAHVEDSRENRDLPDLFGLTPDEIRGMDAEAFFVAFHERGIARHPEEWRQVRDEIAALEVVEVKGHAESPVAVVTCRGQILGQLREPRFVYIREDGRWRAALPSYHLCMRFMTLERKLDAHLPRARVDPTTIDLLIEIGPGLLENEELARLREHVVSREASYGGVVIDAAPFANWQSVVSVVDTLRECGAADPSFATAGSPGPPAGLRLNGVTVWDDRIPDPPRDHPALRRILNVGWFDWKFGEAWRSEDGD